MTKNFEAKKITKEVIEQMNLYELTQNNTYETVLETIVQNIFSLLNSNDEQDIQKFIMYLQNLYMTANGDLQIFLEKFMSTFNLVNIYSAQEEKMLRKKVKKVKILRLIFFSISKSI